VNYFHQLFDSLALSESNGLYITSSKRHEVEGIFSKKVEQNIDLINPYAFFIFNKEPLILFFDETQNNTRTHQLCWNFNVTPIIFFVSETDINIYNGFELDNAKTNNPLLKKIASAEQKSSFSFWHITSGQTFEEYTLNTKKRVDKQLLANIKVARAALINTGLPATLANNLIGRLIFVRYLIDREVKVGFSYGEKENLDGRNFLEIIQDKNDLYRLFKHLKDKFKGDLFPIQEEEIDNLTPQHQNILYRLFNGDDLGNGQISLFQVYNFKILPTEFISNIYEYFMGDEKKKSHKSYYTPSFLVNYILNETVSTYFDNHPTYDSCKVIDPTCGSGIFLVEAYRRIVNQYEKLHGKITNGNRDKLKYLLQENIYGIDKDPDAVNVAIFSLYITLLDYQEPKEIETFEFPNLLNTNFFVQDIFDFYLTDIFTYEKDENYVRKLESTHFQFIIGNPPWGEVEGSPYLDYIKKRSKYEDTDIQIADKQFAPAFLVRTSNFCREDTQCAVVVNSKILYNQKAQPFRFYFLNNFYLNRIFEMSPIHSDVFNSSERTEEGANAAATVLFYRYADKRPTSQNEVVHVSVKYNTFYNLLKLLVIEKNDIKKLKQINFINHDWIWKVLLYGNVLDYHFIKRILSKEYQSIFDFISQESDFLTGVGLHLVRVRKIVLYSWVYL
jgi:hypothetical protein